MSEVIFCFAALLFLAWVIYLKIQAEELRKQIDKLKDKLRNKVDQQTHGAEVDKDTAIWGHKGHH